MVDRDDARHRQSVDTAAQERGLLLTSTPILAEIAWFLEQRFRPVVAQAFLDDLRSGAYVLDWNAGDIVRIQQLTRRYSDLPLGIADATVIACAERNGGSVLTTDFRHFPVVARGQGTLTVLPESR